MNEPKNDQGSAEFVANAESLRLEGNHLDSLLMLLQGLSQSPSNHPARLLLARVFFELECTPFALREVEQLARALPSNQSLKKLYQAMGGGELNARVAVAETVVVESVVAESEIDFDAIDDLESDQG